MDDFKKKLDIINQSTKDVAYINDKYYPIKGILKILLCWLFIYIACNLIFFTIDQFNMAYEFYNLSWFFDVYNIMRIMICAIIPFILFICISKFEMSLKERRFLKIWLVFPVLFCLDNCLSSISSILNAEVMIAFYQSFPISSIVNIVSLLYLYSYLKYKSILAITAIYVSYCTLSFYYLSNYFHLTNATSFQNDLFISLNLIQAYRVVEILTLLTVIIILNRKRLYEKKSY